MKFESLEIIFQPRNKWKIEFGSEEIKKTKTFYLYFGPFLIEMFCF